MLINRLNNLTLIAGNVAEAFNKYVDYMGVAAIVPKANFDGRIGFYIPR